MNESDLMPARSQPRIIWFVLALLVIAGGLFVFLSTGQRVSRQAETALMQQSVQDQRLRQVDPALMKWRELPQIPTSPRLATYLAVGPAFQIFVGDQRGAEGIKGGISLGMSGITCLAWDGKLLVGTRDGVYAFPEASPSQKLTLDLGPRAYITAIAPAKDGLWIADSGNRQVLHLDKSGKIIGTIGKEQLVTPSPHLKVVLRPDGDLLINNPGKLRVDTYSPAGVLKNSFGKAGVDTKGFCGCCNPIDVALLPDGKIVTAEKGLPRVKVYKADGTLESVVAAPKDLSSQCQPQIAVNRQGQILVLDPPARLVRVFERKP